MYNIIIVVYLTGHLFMHTASDFITANNQKAPFLGLLYIATTCHCTCIYTSTQNCILYSATLCIYFRQNTNLVIQFLYDEVILLQYTTHLLTTATSVKHFVSLFPSLSFNCRGGKDSMVKSAQRIPKISAYLRLSIIVLH